jgi:hypothetical protein
MAMQSPVEITGGQNFGEGQAVEESEDRTNRKYNRDCHEGLLSQFACGTQNYILLKSLATEFWRGTISS